jgi:hypothetical protein
MRGRGISMRGRGISMRGRGISMQSRGISMRRRGISMQSRGISMQSRGILMRRRPVGAYHLPYRVCSVQAAAQRTRPFARVWRANTRFAPPWIQRLPNVSPHFPRPLGKARVVVLSSCASCAMGCHGTCYLFIKLSLRPKRPVGVVRLLQHCYSQRRKLCGIIPLRGMIGGTAASVTVTV